MRELSDGPALRLQAKIAGGANMFAVADGGGTIGAQNLQALEQLLDRLCIPIAGRHCGGAQGRRMRFDLATGLVTIDILGEDSIIL
jgi:chemotaxis receptor (MCP) glutamine deamidase CheD